MERINATCATFLCVALGLLVAAVSGGCAQDVGTIDRTQHNFIKKTDLTDREYYYRTTIVKAPFTSAYSTIGDQGRLERGVFEIREDYLHFMRTYEWIEGSEVFAAKSDSDTPLVDANGKPVTRPVCVDGAGRAVDPKQVEPDIVCEEGWAPSTAVIYVYRGAPLAAFPIESHFDIQREYNPTTGERTNVISENTDDRPWQERDYMRVVWGNPKILNYGRLMFMGLRSEFPDIAGWLPGITEAGWDSLITAQVLYRGDADEPRYLPRFVYDEVAEGEDAKIQYMDHSAAWVFQAPTIFYEDWNQLVPLCWFYPWYAGGIFECSSEELMVRTAFLAVDENDGYASTDYNDNMLEKFGYYRAERQYYDREYGSTFSGQIHKAFLHPIWKQGRDGNGNLIPEADRAPRPIVYYLSERYPRRLVDESLELAKQWSEPYEDVVRHYQGNSPEMFVLCENSNAEAQAAIDDGAAFEDFHGAAWTPGPDKNVLAYHGIVGAEGYNDLCLRMDEPKYNGDIRVNILHAVNEPQQNGLLGFGPPSADPLTGQIISANAYNYVAQMELYANRMADIIEVMSGVMALNEYMSPLYIRRQMKAKTATIDQDDHNLTNDEAIALARGLVDPDVEEAIETMGLPEQDIDWAQARMNIIRQDPSLEGMLVDDAVRLLFRDPSAGSGAALDPSALATMSPRAWANQAGFRRFQQYRLRAAERGLDLVGFSDPSIAGIAEQYGKRYDSAVCQEFADRDDLIFDFAAFNDVKLDPSTEDGQCPKLDAVSDDGWTCEFLSHGAYTGNFWVNTCTTKKLLDQIRARLIEEEGTDPYSYWPLNALWTDSHVPEVSISQQEMKAFLYGIREEIVDEIFQLMYLAIATHEVGHNLGLRHNFTASSDAMNYPREYWDLKAGIGPDDRADDPSTSAFVNGQYRPSTSEEQMWTRESRKQQSLNLRQLQSSSVMDYGAKFNSEFEGVGWYDRAAVKFGYGGLVEVFQEAPDLTPFLRYLDGPDNPALPALNYDKGDTMEAIFRRVHYTNIPNAFVRQTDLGDEALNRMYLRKNVRYGQVAAGEVEVPYRYCEGDRIGSDPWCWTRDSGADAFDIMIDAIDDYETYDWFLYGYGHDSALFWPEDYLARVRSTFYLGKTHYQYWALNRFHYNQNDWWAKQGPGRGAGPAGEDLAWHEDPKGGLAGTLAAYQAYGLIAGAFGRPTPGYYGYNFVSNRFESILDYNPNNLTHAFRVFEDEGARPMYAGWSNEGYDIYPVRAGAIYDRMAAFETLVDPSAVDFIGLETQSDVRRYSLSFFTLFPDQTLALLGGLLTGKVEGYGWCVERDQYGYMNKLFRRHWLEGKDCATEEQLATMQYPPVSVDPEPTDYIFPTTKYRIPMLAAYYGMSLMISDYDRSFMDVTRVFLAGHRTAVDLPDDAGKVTFEHPLSGKIYVAYKSGLEDEFDFAYYLVSEGNRVLETYRLGNGELDIERIVNQYARSPLEFITGKLELVRSMHALYDYTEIPAVRVVD